MHSTKSCSQEVPDLTEWHLAGEQGSHCALPILSSCSQKDVCQFPVVSTLTGAQLCLSAAGQATNPHPAGNLCGSVSGSAAGSFELTLPSINLWKEASVQDKTSPQCWLLSILLQKTSLLAHLRNWNIKLMPNHLPATLCSYPLCDLFSPATDPCLSHLGTDVKPIPAIRKFPIISPGFRWCHQILVLLLFRSLAKPLLVWGRQDEGCLLCWGGRHFCDATWPFLFRTWSLALLPWQFQVGETSSSSPYFMRPSGRMLLS